MHDMRRAIGTSIRTARCDLRRSLRQNENLRRTKEFADIDADIIMQRLDESIDTLDDTIVRFHGSSRYAGGADKFQDDEKEDNGDNQIEDETSDINDDEENDLHLMIDTDLHKADNE